MKPIKNQFISLATVFTIVVSVLVFINTAAYAFSGDGSEGNPFEIKSASDLEQLAADVNSGETYENVYFVLINNVNLKGNVKEQWIPIGNSNFAFNGSFNGNGKEISGLYIKNATDDYVGLFGKIGKKGEVRNLTLSGKISGNSSYIGAIAGENAGTIANCKNKAEIGEGVDTQNFFGGIAGVNCGEITNSYNTATVIGAQNVGGIAGANNLSARIQYSYNTGKVKGEKSVGGIVGVNIDNSLISDCYNTNSVTGSEEIGGIVGSNLAGSKTERCYNTGKIKDFVLSSIGESSANTFVDSVGGIAGINTGEISDSFYLNESANGGVAGSDISGAARLLREQFQTLESFGWNDEIWTIDSTVKRPLLLSNGEDTLQIVAATGDALEITTNSRLSEALVNVPYSTTITATGGTPPYKFEIVSSFVPPDLKLDANTGVYSGTPKTGGKTYSNVQIRVTDNTGAKVTKKFKISVHALLVDFKIGDHVFSYDGFSHGVTATPYINGVDASSTTVLNYDVTVGGQKTQTNVGEYPIAIDLKTAGYMVGSIDKSGMSILPNGDVNISFTGNSFSYKENTPQGPAISVTGKKTPSSPAENLTYTTSYEGIDGTDYDSSTAPTLPGTYRVKCLVTNNNFETPINNRTIFTIDYKTVNFNLNDNSPFYFGDTWTREYVSDVPSITTNDFTVNYVKDGKSYDIPSDVGTYEVNITLKDGSIYKVDEITPKYVTVMGHGLMFTMKNTSKEYIDAVTAQEPTIENNAGLERDVDYTVSYIDSKGQVLAGAPINADEYTVEITLLEPDNFSPVIFPTEKFVINKKKIAFSISDNHEFTNSVITPDITITPEIDHNLYTIDYKQDGNSVELKNAGTYDVEITISDNNYTVDDENSNDTITIIPKKMDFTVSDNVVDFNDSEQEATIEPTDPAVPKSAYTVQYKKDNQLYDKAKDVGVYNIIITSNDDNYTLGDYNPKTMTIRAIVTMNLGNSPAAMIFKDTDHINDAAWQEASLEYFQQNHKFDTNSCPKDCVADIKYSSINGMLIDSDKYTLIVKDINNIEDPGIDVGGTAQFGKLEPVTGCEGLYKLVYTPDTRRFERYVMLISNKIGDTNKDGKTNAIDANIFDDMTTDREPVTVTEARVWDVNKDEVLNADDGDAIRRRFSSPLTPYYPWL